MLGMLLDKEGTREEAEDYLEESTKLAPDSAGAHQHLGRHFATTDRHEKQLPVFREQSRSKRTQPDMNCWVPHSFFWSAGPKPKRHSAGG
jgi:uncharacterized protein HemY